jgi:branched-chain amino acid transport system ATP-binding protein|nr:ABC transporter ATP-binding protein [Pseudonocardia dioxanivorans]
MLKVDAVTARYGDATVLDGVSLTVANGEVVGLFGRNGAGKSTLLRVLSGLHPVASGGMEFAGRPVAGLPAHEIARLGTCLVREGAPMPGSLTVTENVQLGRRAARLRGADAPSLDEVWDMFPLLTSRMQARAGFLSGGQRQALALAVAFASAPRMLLLDEPSAGLAPKITAELYEIIGRLASGGTAALIVEQNPAWLTRITRRSYVLDLGTVVSEGDTADLTRRLTVDGAPRS